MSGGPCPSNRFMRSLRAAAKGTAHPFGGLEFRHDGVALCFARFRRRDRLTVEISGMYAPVRGGGHHAMQTVSALADLHGVTLCLVAASSVPDRMDTDRLVEWYRRFGFSGNRPQGRGVAMVRLPGNAPPE